MTAPINAKRQPPYKVAGLILTILMIIVIVLVYLQFRGDFLSRMFPAKAHLQCQPSSLGKAIKAISQMA